MVGEIPGLSLTSADMRDELFNSALLARFSSVRRELSLKAPL